MIVLFATFFHCSPNPAYATPLHFRSDGANLTWPSPLHFGSDNVTLTRQPGPASRGTLSILVSCISTLVICLYTAIHLNVPMATESRTQWKTWLTWIFIGIAVPEMVTLTAGIQHSDAKFLTKQIKKIWAESHTDTSTTTPLSQEEISGNLERLKFWTLHHSFFVVMGGYQFRPESTSEYFHSSNNDFKPSDQDTNKYRRKNALTPAGMLDLIHRGYIDKIPVPSEADLIDRSKTNAFVKCLASVQLLWFFAQVISRWLHGFAVTELEASTFSHVICTLCVYVLWYKNPLSVTQPIWVEHEGLEEWLLIHAGLTTRNRTILAESEMWRDEHSQSDLGKYLVMHVHDSSQRLVGCHHCRSNREIKGCYELIGTALSPDVCESLLSVASRFQSISNGYLFVDFIGSKDNMDQSAIMRDMRILNVNSAELKVLYQIWSLPNHTKRLWNTRDLGLICQSSRMIKIRASWKFSSLAFCTLAISAITTFYLFPIWFITALPPMEQKLWSISTIVALSSAYFLYFLLSLRINMSKEDYTGALERWRTYRQILSTGSLRVFKGRSKLGKAFWKYVFKPNFLALDTLLRKAYHRAAFNTTFVALLIGTIILILLEVAFVLSRLFISIESFVCIRIQPE